MAEAPRNQLPSGYDEEFVNEPEDEILCLICHLPLKEPVLTRCGHRFCKDCLEEHFKRQGIQWRATSCPADREGLDRHRDVFPDKATERKILSLAIKCPSDGCEWTGELRNKEVHLASCLFKLVPCTNKNCHVAVQRKNLEAHVTITCKWRIIKCDHCSKSHPECKMKDHIGQCSKFPVLCPNNCGVSIPRELVPNHIVKDCPLTIISCPYEEMGCETKVQRRQLDSHLESTVRRHLDLSCVKLKNTEVMLNDTKVKLNDTQSKLKHTEIRLNNTEVKLNNTEAKLNDTEVRLQETTRSLMEKLEALERRFEEKKVEDQENASKEKIVMVKTADPRVVHWKINDFSEKLTQAKTWEKETTECTPFYTEKKGYKLKVRMYPNGNGSGENTHLTVLIVVMKGEHDAILPWPFKKQVKFTLIDQQENPAERENVIKQFIPGDYPEYAKYFSRPTQEENTGCGLPKLISHVILYSRRYLVDDTLFLQVEIGQ